MNINEIRRRFVNDFKLPIPVIESPWFEFFLDLYEKDWNTKTDYKRLVGTVEKNPNFMLSYYTVRENMINYIKGTDSYQKFNKHDMSTYSKPKFSGVRTKSIYNEEFAGGTYISLDLKKANLQALRYWDHKMFIEDDSLLIDEVWEKWVESLCNGDIDLEWYIKKSKYIRQVVFGNCNPKRCITLERFMIGEAVEEFIKITGEGDVIFASNDEIIIKPSVVSDLPGIESQIFEKTGIEVRIDTFFLESTPYLTGTGETLRAYKKISYPNGSVDYKDISRNYFAQVYMDQNGIAPDPEDRDLVFYHEKDIAKFLKRIKNDSIKSTD